MAKPDILTADDWDGIIPIDAYSFDTHAGQPGINTQIDYQYRDAANYKRGSVHVLAGELTLEQIARIEEMLLDREFFLPERVGLDALNPWEWSDDYDDEIDHQLHEINEISLTTTAPTTTLTAEELLRRFESTRETGWQFHTEDEFLYSGSLAP